LRAIAGPINTRGDLAQVLLKKAAEGPGPIEKDFFPVFASGYVAASDFDGSVIL
jgi:hypothetical protein